MSLTAEIHKLLITNNVIVKQGSEEMWAMNLFTVVTDIWHLLSVY